jgi:hypothetical protein
VNSSGEFPEIELGQVSAVEGQRGELEERPRSPNKRTRGEMENESPNWEWHGGE